MASVIEPGDKLHIMTRRGFEEDVRRHFLGEVTAVELPLVEIRGYTFIFQPGGNAFHRIPEDRTRLFGLADAGHVVNKIPGDVELESVAYKSVGSRLVISDGRSFSLPINEFGPSR